MFLVSEVKFLSHQATAIETLTSMTAMLKDTAIAFDGSESVTEVEQGAGNVLFALVNLLNSSAYKIRNGTQLSQVRVLDKFRHSTRDLILLIMRSMVYLASEESQTATTNHRRCNDPWRLTSLVWNALAKTRMSPKQGINQHAFCYLSCILPSQR